MTLIADVQSALALYSTSIDPRVPFATSGPTGSERAKLHSRYEGRILLNPSLTRFLVSFQGNRRARFQRWMKYKEGFSVPFVQHILSLFPPRGSEQQRLLDPFAGAGTTLLTGSEEGWDTVGIELLPVALSTIEARTIANRTSREAFRHEVLRLASTDVLPSDRHRFKHIPITSGAFPNETEDTLSGYLAFVETIADPQVRYLFWFAGMCVLEEVSYTRKDGQYLRWDARALGRRLRSTFSKSSVADFLSAVTGKLRLMLDDLDEMAGTPNKGSIDIIEGSCLSVLPSLDEGLFDLVITSPPYCNRYDYTRTYALELAYLGLGHDAIKNLRQSLLSATVENRTKRSSLEAFYCEIGRASDFHRVMEVFSAQAALTEVLGILQAAAMAGELNNENIPKMVENYFLEMCVVVKELARVLAPGGRVVMVNDNVQYHGQPIPVDLILSDFAETFGLSLDSIWVLPVGKGNSSQQMGVHGRNVMRKCVYVWSKPTNG